MESPSKRACFFCEATDRKLTNEHTWSAWLENILPNRGRITYFRTNQLVGGEPTVDRWRGKDFNHTVKAVCKQCNEGWMNRIEEDARPFLESMILGHGRNLYEAGQAKVATWGALKAMVFQGKDRDVPIPLSHRREMFATKRPPKQTQVWIGAFTGKVWAQRHFGLGIDRPEEPSIPAYGSTFAVGRLVFQVFGHEAGDSFRRQIWGQLGESLIEIWPYGGDTSWPPPLLLNDDGLIEASNSFARTAGPIEPTP